MGETNGNGSAKWTSLTSIIAVASAVVGGVVAFYLNTSTVGGNVTSLMARVDSLEKNYNLMQEREIVLRTAEAAHQAALIEIETQFCAEDDMRNLMDANMQKTINQLWRKTNNEDAPNGSSYYPHICNRSNIGPSITEGH